MTIPTEPPFKRWRHPPGCPDSDWCSGNNDCFWDCQGDPDAGIEPEREEIDHKPRAGTTRAITESTPMNNRGMSDSAPLFALIIVALVLAGGTAVLWGFFKLIGVL